MNNTIKTRISVTDTLLSIPLGTTIEFLNKDINPRSIIYTISRLKKKGYLFKTSVAGRIDSIEVTRLK
jgi:hypothetical protein|nr:MAG: hypothetical protein [Bacteriophage sp.]UVX76997.1 MAG: hypothetical protein [Bacteriophage sp.]UVY06806.1 MAG: hypothetical protein [Bacteriophage sp.]UVY41579.1 MAG: hypothetical protein [Bacteriophage sp.]UVY67957.1 MAG: hypothetical protein [Bacteriophage sp.]